MRLRRRKQLVPEAQHVPQAADGMQHVANWCGGYVAAAAGDELGVMIPLPHGAPGSYTMARSGDYIVKRSVPKAVAGNGRHGGFEFRVLTPEQLLRRVRTGSGAKAR